MCCTHELNLKIWGGGQVLREEKAGTKDSELEKNLKNESEESCRTLGEGRRKHYIS